jgi:hypothetical protein
MPSTKKLSALLKVRRLSFASARGSMVMAGIFIVLMMIQAAARAEVPKQLELLTFLLGEWKASGSEIPGGASGSATFVLGLQDRVMIRKSYAEYPATEKAPASRHDDLMIIYAGDNGAIGAEYYDSEGHVIRYSVAVKAPGEVSFASDALPGTPRFRLSYKLGTDGILRGEFAIAPPGSPETFASYLAWESRKEGPGDKTNPE